MEKSCETCGWCQGRGMKKAHRWCDALAHAHFWTRKPLGPCLDFITVDRMISGCPFKSDPPPQHTACLDGKEPCRAHGICSGQHHKNL